MGFPFSPRPQRQGYSLFVGAVADQTAGVTIECPTTARGLILHTFEASGQSRGGFNVRPTGSPTIDLDTNVSIVTPAYLSRNDPSEAPLAVVREGLNAAGDTASRPDFWIFHSGGSLVDANAGAVFVPPGFTASFFQQAVNVSVNASIAFDEL